MIPVILAALGAAMKGYAGGAKKYREAHGERTQEDPLERLQSLQDQQDQLKAQQGGAAGASAYGAGSIVGTNPATSGIAAGQAGYGAGKSVSTATGTPTTTISTISPAPLGGPDAKSLEAYEELLKLRTGY